jgi:hypothetical protein
MMNSCRADPKCVQKERGSRKRRVADYVVDFWKITGGMKLFYLDDDFRMVRKQMCLLWCINCAGRVWERFCSADHKERGKVSDDLEKRDDDEAKRRNYDWGKIVDERDSFVMMGQKEEAFEG